MRIGIDCIGIAVLCYCCTPDGKWVVHKRGEKTKTSGVFNFLSGKLNFEEQPYQAVQREVKEEYGVGVNFAHALPPHVGILESNRGKRHHWLMLPYFVLLNDSEFNPCVKEVEEITLVENLDDIPKPWHNGLEFSLLQNRYDIENFRDEVRNQDTY